MSAEASRQREVFRFYNPWLEKYGNSVSALRGRSKFEETTSISFKPQSSSDIALISFAQLGCLRLNAKRGIIVLISTDTQFILCEATKTLSLARGARHMAGDELWFGSGSLKRQDGMSDQSLNPENYTATNADGSTFTCPAFVVNDLTTDAHYSFRGFVRGGIRFYCGVPIVAENGQAIGAYTVTDDKPRDGVTGEELQFMYDMSRVVADHLLVIRQASARQRGEFLVRTLASFIEGRTEYASHSAEEKEVEQAPVTAASTEEKPSTKVVGIDMSYLASVKPQSRNHTQSSKTDAPRSEDHTGQIQVLRQDSQASTDSESMHDAPHVATADAEAMASAAMTHNASQPQVFQRAADLLRRATTADGVLFFDAVAANALAAAKSGVSADAHAHYTTSKGVQRSDSSSDRGHPERPHLDKHGSHNSDISIASQSSGRTHSDSDSMGSFHRASRSKQSGILGISVKPGSVPSTSRAALDNLQIREVDLRRTTKRYPQGRVFLFNEAGYLTSSDTDGSDSTKRKALASGSDMQPDQTADEKRQGERRIANALHKAVPTARNMVFLPMWDFAMDRWHAGAFIWSNKEELLLTVQDDLSYIKAFSFAVMSEVARLNSIESDLAKTTFLANISHELRSPLHGILGSIEFIQETVLDAFQSSLITSIETCGKTLLDTVDHVLDHSKINQLSPKGPSAIGFADASSGVPNSNVHSLTEKFDLGVMVEEVVEAVYSGQTFRNRKLSPSTDESPTRDAQDNESDADQIRALSSGSGGKTFITLSIEHGVDWQVFSQPGAIRRILMNLVGNSLKYTTHGGINVTLETRKVKQHSERNDQVLKLWLKVEDTGKGISEDFLKHHLFTPFRQENYFSSGTGLGLSIAQQVVASLDGKIDVRSKLGEGTEVRVALDLVRVPELAKTNILETLNDVRRQTKGQVICIPSPSLQIPQHYARDDQRLQSPGKAFAAIAEEWFDMRIEQSENMQDVTADYLVYAEPPPVDFLIQRHGQDSPNATVPVILICQNAQESAWLIANGLNKLTDNGRVVEIMSQPCGPQKFAKVIRRCLRSLAEGRGRQNRPAPQEKAIEEGAAEDLARPHQTTQDASIPSSQLNANRSRRPISFRSQSLAEVLHSDSSSSGGDHRKMVERPLLGPRLSSRFVASDVSSSGDELLVPEQRLPRILVVDDNPINLQLLNTFMARAQLPYASASDGMEAVTAFKAALTEADQEAFSYILMDVSMPKMDGIEATKEIRAIERQWSSRRSPSSGGKRRRRDTLSSNQPDGEALQTASQDTDPSKQDEMKSIDQPQPDVEMNGRSPQGRSSEAPKRATIIALTGLANDETRQRAEVAGMDRFLAKPIRFRDIKTFLV